MKIIRDRLIKVGHAEGISFLVLLFIAMPLKYWGDMPLAVRIVGSLHGILFVAFIAVLIEAKTKMNLTLMVTIKAFIASLIPFGTFFLHKIVPESLTK